MTNLLNKSSLSRSARLRKYEVAYEECIKKTFDTSKKKPNRLEPSKKSRSIRNVSPKKSKVKQSPPPPNKKKRSLNAYQKFVKEESQKNKYKSFTPSERMKEISKEWNKKKI